MGKEAHCKALLVRKESLEGKMITITERRANTLDEKTKALSHILKSKHKRGLQVKQSRAFELVRRKERLESKLVEATERKYDALGMMQTVNLSSVRSIVSEQLVRDYDDVSTTTTTTTMSTSRSKE